MEEMPSWKIGFTLGFSPFLRRLQLQTRIQLPVAVQASRYLVHPSILYCNGSLQVFFELLVVHDNARKLLFV